VIVIDASVLIAHLDAHDPHHERAVGLLLDHAEQTLACSTITLAEVLVGPARNGRLDAARTAVGELGLTEVALPPDAAPRLATLRADTNLKLPDCCVLVAAQDAHANAVLTFDDRLTREAARLGFGDQAR
jgi:predicted nucleic acid-binding protein